MRVLGVDPGLTRCGLGVVDGGQGRRATLVEAGVVRTSPDADVAARLCAVQDGVADWLARYQPDAVAVERVFSQANVRTVMGTAQAGAVAIVVAARRGLPVGLYTPSEVKAAVTGSGRADKAQVAFMIKKLLELDAAPRPADAADAVALALCHLWRGPALARMRDAAAGVTAAGVTVRPGAGAGADPARGPGPSPGPGTIGRGAPAGGAVRPSPLSPEEVR